MARVGVVLLNLGGPERIQDVGPFLYNLFADPEIIQKVDRITVDLLQKVPGVNGDQADDSASYAGAAYVFKADVDAPYSAVMSAMDKLRAAQVENVGLITERKIGQGGGR